MQSSKSFIKSYLKKLPIGFIVLLGLFAGAMLLFVMLVHEVFWEKEEDVDEYVFDFLSSYISPGLTNFMKGVTYFASGRFLQISYAILFLFYLLINKNIKRAFEIAAIGIGGFVINYFMKLSFQRIRPPHPLIDPLKNFSFPSGHATSGFIFYGLLVYLIWKTDIPNIYKYIISALLLLFAVLIGFSRVYLRVHYTSDVVGGFCIGLAWLLLTTYVFERLKKKSSSDVKSEENKA